MYFRESGNQSAPAVLLIHGQMLDGSIYDMLASRLSSRFRVLIPDLPGYGRSPILSPYSLAGIRRALEAELLARGVRSAAVVAYSLGGYHALSLALSGRVEVTRLALLAPAAWADASVREAFRQYGHLARGGLRPGRLFAEIAIPPDWAAAHPEVVSRVVAAADAVSQETYVAEFEAVAAGEMEDLRPRLASLRAPLLVRVGEGDRRIPLALAQELVAATPGAQLEVIPGCWHLPLEQDAGATAASIERFLGGTAG